MNDISSRLRKAAEAGRSPILGHLHVEDHLMIEAADEIELLYTGLKRIADCADEDNEWDAVDKFHDCRGIARRILGLPDPPP